MTEDAEGGWLGGIAHDTGGGFSPGRVAAMLLRYLYLLRSSWPRVLELIYWPTIQMILWGFMSQFLRTNSSWVASAFGVLLAAVLLWDVMFRGQLGVSMSFLEEMWARNLGHLFVSPLRPYEWVLSLLAMSLIRVIIGVVPAMLLANLLVMGWALGLIITALILRHGMGAETIAWLAIFILAPVSAVYYPVAILPGWLQYVSAALPSAHVFEGMRALMFAHVFRLDHFAAAVALNLLYIALGAVAFLWSFRSARRRGALLHVGE